MDKSLKFSIPQFLHLQTVNKNNIFLLYWWWGVELQHKYIDLEHSSSQSNPLTFNICSLENLLERHILGIQHRPTESETLGVSQSH